MPVDKVGAQSGTEGAGTTERATGTRGSSPLSTTASASDADLTTDPVAASSSSSSAESSGSTTTTDDVTASGAGPDDSDAQPTSGPGSDTAACGFVPGDPECGECLASECCDHVSTCLADPGCGCILGCFDQLTPAGLLPCLGTRALGSIPPDLTSVLERATEVCPVCL